MVFNNTQIIENGKTTRCDYYQLFKIKHVESTLPLHTFKI